MIRQIKLKVYIRAFIHRPDAPSEKTILTEADLFRLYEALANNPLTAQRLAMTADVHPDAVAEWLGTEIRQGHLQYDAARQQYWISPQQAMKAGPGRGLWFPGIVLRKARRMVPIARY
ncbi:hypothetical protein [Caballeronia grimmiae]|uniref:hypothetical protein n=1 Tax=Caballeronia grimmiae TaxID=1071679 RepID=UPI0038B824F1